MGDGIARGVRPFCPIALSLRHCGEGGSYFGVWTCIHRRVRGTWGLGCYLPTSQSFHRSKVRNNLVAVLARGGMGHEAKTAPVNQPAGHQPSYPHLKFFQITSQSPEQHDLPLRRIPVVLRNCRSFRQNLQARPKVSKIGNLVAAQPASFPRRPAPSGRGRGRSDGAERRERNSLRQAVTRANYPIKSMSSSPGAPGACALWGVTSRARPAISSSRRADNARSSPTSIS